MRKLEKKENICNLFLSFILIGLICILNCSIYIELIVGVCTVAVLILSIKYKWNCSRCFFCFLAIAMMINFYFDYKTYSPYRNEQSGNYNSRCGFTTSQVAYTYNSGNSDVLLYLILKNKDAISYGNIEPYYNLLEQFSNNCINVSGEEDVDFLIDMQNEFWDMGRVNPYNAGDCFDIDEANTLREIRNTNKPCLYILSDEFVKKERVVVVVDSLHNFYIMTEEQWEEIYSEEYT